MSVPLPAHESARLAALARAGLLDPAPEEAFGRITRLAARLLDVPCAAVTLLDGERQFIKSCQGPDLAGTSLPREESPCAWAMLGRGPLLIEDLGADPRFCRHPLVGPPHGLRMYAGMPLVTAGGEVLGTLCVLDTRARTLDIHELDALVSLAALVVAELEGRAAYLDLTCAREEAELLRDLAALIDRPLTPEETTSRALGLLRGRTPLAWSGLLRLDGEGPEVRAEVGERGGLLDALAHCPTRRGEPLFLEAREVALAFPELAGQGAVAWLSLPGEDSPHALALVRGEGQPTWNPGERSWLEAAARPVGVALEREEHARRLERAALTDPLTGLGNRRAFDLALEEADRHLAATGAGYVLAVVDLDGMRRVNEECGRVRGDELLREFARQLGHPDVTAYRLGGDEYALLHPRPGLPEVAAQALVNRVAGAVRFTRSLAYPVGASVGVASVPDDAPGSTGALRAALRRMHARKRARPGPAYGR